MSLLPMFGHPALIRAGDAVATTYSPRPNTYEAFTFLGYCVEPAVKGHTPGTWIVRLDTGKWAFANTQTLAIWSA